MDVIATPAGGGQAIPLGKVSEQIWVGGFRKGESRSLEARLFAEALNPVVFDNIGTVRQFSFAAGRSLDDAAAALLFLGTHADQVPRLCDLTFTAFGQSVYLLDCGIDKVDLAEKNGAYVSFTYSIIGGRWSATPTLK